MDLYLRVRLACHVDGLSQREAASRFGIARETVRKMLRHSEPPGYRRRQPPKRPKLAPFTDIIDRILEEDRTVHRKQHHTAKRIFERLRDEHGSCPTRWCSWLAVGHRRSPVGSGFETNP